MKKLTILLILFTTTLEAQILLREHNGVFCYDGDTCYVEIDGKIRDKNGNLLKIRLLELDTPEISHPKCEKEYTHGIEARNYINKYILDGEKIEFETEYNRDFFDRILAYIIVDGENVSKIMVLNGLGVVYDKNNKKDWCE